MFKTRFPRSVDRMHRTVAVLPLSGASPAHSTSGSTSKPRNERTKGCEHVTHASLFLAPQPRCTDALKAGEKCLKVFFTPSAVSKSVLHTLYSVSKCLLLPVYWVYGLLFAGLQLYQNGMGCEAWSCSAD